jgi:hypothetical protein
MARFGLLALALASSAFSQSIKYEDPNSGISFSGRQPNGITFGIALPETSGSDFIGHIV